MTNAQTTLIADSHVERYNADPLEVAEILSEIWCKEHTGCVDVWGCDWPCPEFFEAFLDHCREKGFLKEALKIWWCVHNCPGPETDPCNHNYVCQQVIDYSKKYGLESETVWLKEHGLDKFQSFIDIGGTCDIFGWGVVKCRLTHDVYPNPKDENGRFIPLIKSKDGRNIYWPKHEDGRFLTLEELEKSGI